MLLLSQMEGYIKTELISEFSSVFLSGQWFFIGSQIDHTLP